MANKIIHKNSSVITDGVPKLPGTEQLDYGEIAINYGASGETISIKNSNNQIVEFKSKDYFETIIEENERIVAGALSDLDEKITEFGDSIEKINQIELELSDNEFVIANALNDLNERLESIGENGGAGESSISVENLTYSELSEKILSNTLVPGSKYRITDYVTMCVDSYQYNSSTTVFIKSANHPFDIIVEALSENTLSEDAKAIQREGDTYFTDNNLDAWELKYCFDNDTSRFGWVDSSCKGVIYYMKDEFNNEAWYDFKNIMFMRDASFLTSYPIVEGLTSNTYFYTFSVVSNGEIKDDTLYTTNYHATDNHLGRNTAKITNTIFIDKSNNGVFNNIIGDGHANNTFGQSIWNNRIGHNCIGNIIVTKFQYNDITSNFSSNHILNSFAYNNVESGCVNNRFNGSVTKCTFKQAYSLNNFTGSTLSNCTFGTNIKYVSDMPNMSNVTFDNEVINGDNSIYLNNLSLDNGQNILTALSNNTSNVILSKYNDKYRLVNVANNDDLLDCIYDLGSFSNNKGGEDAAYNINLIRNPKILFLRFFNTSTNKYVYIKQITNNINCGVGEWGCTKQYIYLDGRVDVRKCWFQNVLGSYQTATDTNHTTSWMHLEDADGYLYSNGNKIVANERKSIKQTINATDSNNANVAGYYGKLSNLGLKGSNINFESISVYRRNGTGIANYEVLCKVLVKNNNQWVLVSKSNNKINVYSKSAGEECKFNMTTVENALMLSSNDVVAIVFSNNESASPKHCVNMGLKTTPNCTGAINIGSTEISTELSVTPNVQSYSPSISFEYKSINDIEYVSTSKDEEINGIKTFNNGINVKGDIVITDSDGDKTVIKTAIDKGELKVYSGNTTNGFIIKPNGLSEHNIPNLELLATNNSYSYKYKLPSLWGTNQSASVGLSTHISNQSHNYTVGRFPLIIGNEGTSYVDLQAIKNGTGITSGSTGMVQGKAVHEYAAPKSHTHTTSDISGLQTALIDKQDAFVLGDGLQLSSSDVLSVKYDNSTIKINNGKLKVNYGKGLEYSSGIRIKLGTGYAQNGAAGTGLGFESLGGLYVKIGTGLTYSDDFSIMIDIEKLRALL